MKSRFLGYWKQKEVSLSLLTVIVFFGIVTYLFQQSVNNNIGDFHYYSDSGASLLQKNNIYEEGARWGTFAALGSFLMFGLLPPIVVNFFLVLSIPVGSILFCHRLGLSKSQSILVGCVATMSTASRESLQNGQVTGQIILLFGISLIIRDWKFSTIAVPPVILYCLELKPHVTIPLLLFFHEDVKRFYKNITIVLISSHAFIDFYVGRFLEFDFARRLLTLSNKDSLSDWPDINNLLPLINVVIDNSTTVKLLASILFTTTMIYSIFSKHRIILILLGLLISPYMHTYDLVGILGVCIAAKVKKSQFDFADVFFVAVCLAPSMISNPILLILTLMISTLFTLSISPTFSIKLKTAKILLLVTSIATQILLTLNSDQLFARSYFVVIVLISLIGLSVETSTNSIIPLRNFSSLKYRHALGSSRAT